MATGQGGAEIRYGLSTALTCNHEAPIVFRTAQTSSNGCGVKAGHAYTLDGAGGQAVVTALTVRRFTPLEHERLQGFPDDYTRIPYRGRTPEKCPDSLRYEALGNSMAVPVMRWIGERIRMSGGRVES
jgi:DNA (cytosine-5)-methyltransferase 1